MVEGHEEAQETFWGGFEIRDEGRDCGRGKLIGLEDVVYQCRRLCWAVLDLNLSVLECGVVRISV